jgi:hypothetical protein
MSTGTDEKSLLGAMQLSGLEAKWLHAFEVEDPFNDNLRLRGFLSQKPDHRYGALVLTHVGNAEAPQLILATPKLHYPFGKDGKFHFPPIKKFIFMTSWMALMCSRIAIATARGIGMSLISCV